MYSMNTSEMKNTKRDEQSDKSSDSFASDDAGVAKDYELERVNLKADLAFAGGLDEIEFESDPEDIKADEDNLVH